jgi:hypothetical protein
VIFVHNTVRNHKQGESKEIDLRVFTFLSAYAHLTNNGATGKRWGGGGNRCNGDI